MKLPISTIARFALRIGVRALAKAAADPKKPLTRDGAKDALVQELREAAMKEAVRRGGMAY